VVMLHLVVEEVSDLAAVGLQVVVNHLPWPDQVELERVVVAVLVARVPYQVDS